MAKKSERTRQTLLEAALRIIGRKGYTSATVDEIVKEAGVSKGVAYYHFKSKADMATGILNSGLGRIIVEFEQVVADAPDATSALLEMLDRFAAGLYENREFARFLMAELWRSGRVWSDEMREKAQSIIDIIAAQLERGQQEGRLNPEGDPHFSAVSLIGMAVTDAMYYAGPEGEPQISKDEFTDRIRTFARHALA